jgi:hypothetical protein
MKLRPFLFHGIAALFCGLSLPAHAFCFGLLGEGCVLSVAKNNDLQFGSMVVTGSGSVTLDPQGGALTGPVMTPTFLRGNTKPAEFTVQCTVKSGITVSLRPFFYRVSVEAGPSLDKTYGTAANMAIDNFSIRPLRPSVSQSTENEYEVRNCEGYSQTFTVGARLTVDASQTPGTYDSTLNFLASP